MATKSIFIILMPLVFLLIGVVSNAQDGIEQQAKTITTKAEGRSFKLANIFSQFKQTSIQGASFLRRSVSSIPIGKIVLIGGALLSLFFIFLRLLVVLGPILILGAMTRESTDATDVLRMLIEFYNQVIVALDEQMIQPSQT